MSGDGGSDGNGNGGGGGGGGGGGRRRDAEGTRLLSLSFSVVVVVVVDCDDSAFLFGRLPSKEITFAHHLYHLVVETIVVENCNISQAGTTSDFEDFGPSLISGTQWLCGFLSAPQRLAGFYPQRLI